MATPNDERIAARAARTIAIHRRASNGHVRDPRKTVREIQPPADRTRPGPAHQRLPSLPLRPAESEQSLSAPSSRSRPLTEEKSFRDTRSSAARGDRRREAWHRRSIARGRRPRGWASTRTDGRELDPLSRQLKTSGLFGLFGGSRGWSTADVRYLGTEKRIWGTAMLILTKSVWNKKTGERHRCATDATCGCGLISRPSPGAGNRTWMECSAAHDYSEASTVSCTKGPLSRRGGG
jgi:hypothetical protein